MKSTDVNPSNFKVEKIVYDNGVFSIAYGTWLEDGARRLGMLWNGEGDSLGYPSAFSKPMWFQVDDTLTAPFMQALITLKEFQVESLLEKL